MEGVGGEGRERRDDRTPRFQNVDAPMRCPKTELTEKASHSAMSDPCAPG